MRKEYDFANSIKNPYEKKVKKQISIRIETNTIAHFKELSKEVGIPYQNLINSYLVACANQQKKNELNWE